MHPASALAVASVASVDPVDPVASVMVVWDARLHAAAGSVGLRVAPLDLLARATGRPNNSAICSDGSSAKDDHAPYDSEEHCSPTSHPWRFAGHMVLVVGTGVDPVTSRFSGARSTN